MLKLRLETEDQNILLFNKPLRICYKRARRLLRVRGRGRVGESSDFFIQISGIIIFIVLSANSLRSDWAWSASPSMLPSFCFSPEYPVFLSFFLFDPVRVGQRNYGVLRLTEIEYEEHFMVEVCMSGCWFHSSLFFDHDPQKEKCLYLALHPQIF